MGWVECVLGSVAAPVVPLTWISPKVSVYLAAIIASLVRKDKVQR